MLVTSYCDVHLGGERSLDPSLREKYRQLLMGDGCAVVCAGCGLYRVVRAKYSSLHGHGSADCRIHSRARYLHRLIARERDPPRYMTPAGSANSPLSQPADQVRYRHLQQHSTEIKPRHVDYSKTQHYTWRPKVNEECPDIVGVKRAKQQRHDPY